MEPVNKQLALGVRQKIKKIISGVALLFGTGEYAANLQENTHVEVRFQ